MTQLLAVDYNLCKQATLEAGGRMTQFSDLQLKSWRIRVLIALSLALALVAVGAQAQDFIFDCARIDEFILLDTHVYPEEHEWYGRNCVEKEEEIIHWPPLPTPTPRPPVDTCGQLPAHIGVSGHRVFHTQCQRLGAAGVGNDALMAQGVLDAVDVWAHVDSEVRVCFRQQGRLKFLDAATAPRQVSDLAAEYVDGSTCGRINRVGTVVLLPGGAPQGSAAGSGDGEPPIATTSVGSTTICELETNALLSLRAGPSISYSRLLSMPAGSGFIARARIGDWYMVNFEGQWGWSSARHMTASPACDALDDQHAVILPQAVDSPAPPAEASTTESEETGPVADAVMSGCQLTTVALINLRAGPGLAYEVLAEIPYQATLRATAEADDWFEVEYLSQTGWVSREYVYRWGSCDVFGNESEMLPAPTPEPSAPQAETQAALAEEKVMDLTFADARPLTGCNLQSGDIINLRAGPGIDYAVLAEIPNETNLTATARTRDWFKVQHEAAVGWVHIDYVFRNGACG